MNDTPRSQPSNRTRGKRTPFLGLWFDAVSLQSVSDHLLGQGDCTGRPAIAPGTLPGTLPGTMPGTMVVTPNADHMVRLHRASETQALWPLYQGADLCLCDSRVLARLARLQGRTLTVVTGSDLTRHLLASAPAGSRMAIVGGTAQTVQRLAELYPRFHFIQHCPPWGLNQNPQAIDEAARFICETAANLTFIAVGSPQQEKVARAAHDRGAQGALLCIGAALEFLTGEARRAPIWVQKLGLEWAHRMMSDPRRLARRYLIDNPAIFTLAWRWRHWPGH